MGVWRDACFCSGGGGRSEKLKGGIFSGGAPAMAAISGGGAGFLIHRSLLLTAHGNVPSPAAAEAAEVRISRGRVFARLVPHRFFITSSILDLTIVGLDIVDADSTSQEHQPHYLKTCCNSSINLGNVVYLLGHTDTKELVVGEGKVVIATDNLIKMSTDGATWSPGSAGFDGQGNLAFMVCDPMKLATSPSVRSSASASSSSSQSWKKDTPMQFGIPIPIIRDWLHQHWEGNLDELSKPKLPLIRLMSSGQKSEHSSASFTQRRVFKPMEGENDDIPSSSQIASNPRFHPGLNSSAHANISHEQGIPTPEICESPKLTLGPLRKTVISSKQLLDINFPPRATSSIVLPLPLKQLLMNSEVNNAKEPKSGNHAREDSNHEMGHDIVCAGPESDCCSEVMSSSPHLEPSRAQNDADGFSSGEETMYSAETMESRNFSSPKENRFQQVGRSRSCVNYSRWSSSQRNSATRKGAALQKQQSMILMRKARSQATSLPQRSHDYFSPTVSSSMKKRNSSEKPIRPNQNVIQASPRQNR